MVIATQSAPSAETPRINFSLPRRMAFRMDSLLASTPAERWVKGRLQCPCNTNVTGSEKNKTYLRIFALYILLLLLLLLVLILLYYIYYHYH
jgi:hypothetical protein